jgi:hypothetical protein
MGKWATFLPVGKDFTIPARNFLPVGNGLRGSSEMATERHDGRGASNGTVVRAFLVKVPGVSVRASISKPLATRSVSEIAVCQRRINNLQTVKSL